MDMQSQDRESSPAKKPYAPPALLTWGTLRDITQSSGDRGANDGGRGKNKQTR